MSRSRSALPLVTVAMPIYNAGKHLRPAVLSIVNQTHANWELLIIDDGSTDDALRTIEDIAGSDTRIRILRDGMNKGLAARLNECVDLAHGRYIARMDQDDVSYPERLTRQVAMLENTPLLDLVCTRAITISEQDEAVGILPRELTHEAICAAPWRGFYLPHPTWMGRTAWFCKHRYAVPAHYFCEDQELLLRSYAESHFGTSAEILLAYRMRDVIDWKKRLRTRFALLEVQLHHFVSQRQFTFAFMSVLACVGRLIADLRSCMGIGHSGSAKLDEETVREWGRVRKQAGNWHPENLAREGGS